MTRGTPDNDNESSGVDVFQQPSGGGTYFKPAAHEGNLVLITDVHSAEEKHDALREKMMLNVEADLIDLDQEGAVLGRVILVHPAITNKVKVGDSMVLGRVGTVKTKQGKAAYSLLPFTEEDAARAEAWVMANQDRPKFAPPAPITESKKNDEDPFA